MRVTENTQWVQQQFESCELGDKRRTKRVCRMAMNMLECPDKSLPTQSNTWSDVKAAYRRCARDQVTFDAVATPHWEQTRATQPGRYELSLRARPGQHARMAKLEVSTCAVRFPRPHFCSPFVKTCGIDSIAMNVLIVQEVGAAKGVAPIRWVLLSSLPVDSFKAAREIIEFYEFRWLIEEYHKVLKTGCQIERHALRQASRLEPLTALISVIGVRLLQLKTIGCHDRQQRAHHRVPSRWLDALKALRPRLKNMQLTVYEFFRELANKQKCG